MSIENEIKQAINNALLDLSISINFDEDNDLEIAIYHDGKKIHSDYVEIDKVFLKIKNKSVFN